MIKFKFLILGIFISILPDVLGINAGLDYNQKIVLRMMIIMIFFWVTETIPNSITALMPIMFSPFFFEISLK